MTALGIIVCIICQLFVVVGQLFLKRGMTPATARRRRAGHLVLGTVCMAAWFFLWMGLLQRWELSRLFPFEGINPALLMLAAWVFLKERVSPGAWVGIVLISIGVAMVSGS